jgi:hypothetical protein
MDRKLPAISSWPWCGNWIFDSDFDRPGCPGSDNSAIRIAGIEDSADQIGGLLPSGEIAFSFLMSAILFQILGRKGDILTSNGT